jgi:hypothetical protein
VLRPNPDAIAFLAPGLVHQFGNLLLTIQGQALQFSGGDPGEVRAQQAILNASERGGTTLRILRILLGEPGDVPAPAAQLLELLAELVRVPVREAGHRIELVGNSVATTVAANEFFPVLTESTRQLLLAAPSGLSGRLRIELATAAGGVHADLEFCAEVGSLPFPLQLDACVATLGAAAAERRVGTTVRRRGQGLRVWLAELRSASQPCAHLHGSLPEAT